MYRELATHLGQVLQELPKMNLRQGEPFNYSLDQVADLAFDLPQTDHQLLAGILAYYSQQFPQIKAFCRISSKPPQALSDAVALVNYFYGE
jgi:hypothetical protein